LTGNGLFRPSGQFDVPEGYFVVAGGDNLLLLFQLL
jgi:hypothetical protein